MFKQQQKKQLQKIDLPAHKRRMALQQQRLEDQLSPTKL